MKLYNQAMKYNLQYFGDGDGNQDDSGADDQGADDDKKPDSKTFTQEDVDRMITERLKRERAKEKKAKAKEEGNDPDTAKQEAERKQAEKISSLEARLLCFEHDVAKDAVSDVVALAKSYVDDDTNFEEAIEKVIKKYPSFVNGADTSKKDEDDDKEKKSWGERQKGKSGGADGVEAAFLKKNPGLKID